MTTLTVLYKSNIIKGNNTVMAKLLIFVVHAENNDDNFDCIAYGLLLQRILIMKHLVQGFF